MGHAKVKLEIKLIKKPGQVSPKMSRPSQDQIILTYAKVCYRPAMTKQRHYPLIEEFLLPIKEFQKKLQGYLGVKVMG